MPAATQTQHPVEYAPRPKRRVRPRTVIALTLFLVAIILLPAARSVTSKINLSLAQRRCMRFQDVNNVPVFVQSDDEAAAALAKVHPSLVNLAVGLAENHRFGRVVPVWDNLVRLMNLEEYPCEPGGVLFLGELRTPAGERRLVEVHITLHFSNSTSMAFITHVIKPAGLFSAASWSEEIYGMEPSIALGRPTDLSAGVNVVSVWEDASKLYFYPGRATKKDDPTSFQARVVIELPNNGGVVEERVTGRLTNDHTLELQATDDHAAKISKALGQ